MRRKFWMKAINKKTNIVVVGGGTGVFTLLSGLKNYFENLTAIVTMADDGGSTGLLREDFGILPPGDVRRALLALSRSDNKKISELFNYRFAEGSGLVGHSVGNLLITALERMTGNFEDAIREASKILDVRGKVIPITLETTRLYAELENKKIIKGETNIDIPRHDGRLRIKKVWLEPAPRINPLAKRAILRADAVIIGPGDLYTSLLPNILVRGTKEALRDTKAKVFYMTNLMTKFGETNNFKASDFLNTMKECVGPGVIDYIIANNKKPTPDRLRGYVLEKASWVELDRENFQKNSAREKRAVLIEADLVRSRGFVRHDPEKTAKLIRALV